MEIEELIDASKPMRGQKCRVRFWVHRSGKISNIDISETSTTLFSFHVLSALKKLNEGGVPNFPKNLPMQKVLISFVLRTNPLYIIAPEKETSPPQKSFKP